MTEPIFHYDEESDTLYVSFAPGEAATGIALNDHMLLRINKHERRAIGLTLFAYSVLAQTTDVGPRSFPLTGLMQLSDDLRALCWTFCAAHRYASCSPSRRTRRRWLTPCLLPYYNLCPLSPATREPGEHIDRQSRGCTTRHSPRLPAMDMPFWLPQAEAALAQVA